MPNYENTTPIEVPSSVTTFEQEYRLPALLGTPRQVSWARIIRNQFLAELFPNIVDTASKFSRDDAKALYASLDGLRANSDGRYWIEKCKPHLGEAMAFLFAKDELEAADEEQKKLEEQQCLERQRKSQESRAMNKAAEVFEVQYSLPELQGSTPKQEKFARRCRFQLINKLNSQEIESLKEYLMTQTDAGVWIGAVTKNMSMTEVMSNYEVKAND